MTRSKTSPARTPRDKAAKVEPRPDHAAGRSAAEEPAEREQTIEIGGRAITVAAVLLGLALLAGIAFVLLRSSAGTRMHAQVMRWPVPAPSPVELAEMEPDVRDAIVAARAAVEADRGSMVAWRHLGMIYDAHNLWPIAKSSYERALSLAPSDGQTAFHLAVATELADAPIEEVVLAYQRAVALAPDYGPAHLRLGDALMRVGRNLEARDALQRAVEVYPPASSARARRSLGLALLALGDANGAAASLEAATRIRSDDEKTWTALAQAYNQLGRGQEARQASERAASRQETLGYFDDWRLAVLEEAVSRSLVEKRISQKVEMGAIDAALADALRWEAKHPDWQSIKVLIGNLYRTAGREDMAQQYFAAAKALVQQGGASK